MARKRRKVRKMRVDFRRNRAQPRRRGDLTRRYRADEQTVDDVRTSESVRAKGELSRKRTILVDEHEDPLVHESLWRRGLVTSVHGLICRVDDEHDQAWQCTVRRVLRTLLIEQRSGVTVGDRVWFSDQSDHHDGQLVGVIERVEQRRTELARGDRRGRAHLIVANAEQLLVVASVAEPRLKPHLIDRYLVAAGKGDLRPIIVFNKWDLLDGVLATDVPAEPASGAGGPGPGRDDAGEDADPDVDTSVEFEDEQYSGPAMTVDDVVAEFTSLGYTCIRTSATTGIGLDALRDELRGRMTVLSGQSGVGKSSLINALQPHLELEIAEVSEETEKGRHTTSLARLLPLDFGGYVVDTPGIRAFDLWAVEPGELEAYFTEFVPLVPHCRFKDCHHVGEEPGCAVVAAVEAGRISPRRYYSYLKMLEELARS